MIRSLTRTLIGLAALVGLAGTAQAAYVPATWTDTVTPGTPIYLDGGQTHSYVHDITLDGFNVATDHVDNFRLSINLFDDSKWDWFEFPRVFVSGEEVFDIFNWGNWKVAGRAELNATGTLSVSIYSECNILVCGDFYFGGSKLVAWGETESTTSVPEPGSLALLGVGLLGLAVGTRRRKAGNAA